MRWALSRAVYVGALVHAKHMQGSIGRERRLHHRDARELLEAPRVEEQNSGARGVEREHEDVELADARTAALEEDDGREVVRRRERVEEARREPDRLVYDDERQLTEEKIDEVAGANFRGLSLDTALMRPILYSNWLSRDYVPVE